MSQSECDTNRLPQAAGRHKTYFLRSVKLPARICDNSAFCVPPFWPVSLDSLPLDIFDAVVGRSSTPPAIALSSPALPTVGAGAWCIGIVGGTTAGRAGGAAACPETRLSPLAFSPPPMSAAAKKRSISVPGTLSDVILCRTAPSGSPALSIDKYFRNTGRRCASASASVRFIAVLSVLSWGEETAAAEARASAALKPSALAVPAREISESSALRLCTLALPLLVTLFPSLFAAPLVRWRRKTPFILDSNEERPLCEDPRSSLSRALANMVLDSTSSVSLLSFERSDELVPAMYDAGLGLGGGFGGGTGRLRELFLTGRSQVAAASASR